MPETDLILMSLCIFVPTLFALVLLFFPKAETSTMRWWTLLGTAVTLVVSIVLFIRLLLQLMDQNPTEQSSSTSLLAAPMTADRRAAAETTCE